MERHSENKKASVLKPMSLDDYATYMRRDLEYLQGFADAVSNHALGNKIHSMSRNLKAMMCWAEDRDRNMTEEGGGE